MTCRLALAGSAVLCGLSWYATKEWRPVRPVTDAALVALNAEREQLRANDDGTRDALREKRRTLDRQGWTTGDLAALQRELGADWRWEQHGSQQVMLQRIAPQILEWPRYVAVVEDLGGRHGVVVESLEVQAEGTGTERRLVRLAIGLKFIVPGDGDRPARGPATVASGEEPAAARKVGPGPALRRPSDSAEPPSPGQDSASFRPDPPGPGPEFHPKTASQPQPPAK